MLMELLNAKIARVISIIPKKATHVNVMMDLKLISMDIVYK